VIAPSLDRSLWLGDFHPDLESAFAERLRALAPGGDARDLLVVVPNRLLASHLRRRAAELGAATYGLEPRSLEDLIAELAAPGLAAGGWHSIPSGFFTPVLEHLLKGERRRVFAPAGMVRALASTVRDLRDAGVAPEDLEAAVEADLGGAARPREAARLYAAYVRALEKRRLADAASRTAHAVAALEAGSVGAATVLIYGIYDLVGRQRRFLERLLAGRRAEAFFPWRDGAAFAYAEPLRRWFEEQGFAASGPPPVVGVDRLAHLRRFLFEEVAEPAPPPDESLRLLSAPSPPRELGEILREDIAMRAAGGRGSTGILVRRADEAARDAAAFERRAQRTLHLPQGESWRRRPAGAVAAALLGIAAGLRPEDGKPSLERGRVEELLGSGGLAADLFPPGARPGRWTQALRRRGLVGRLDAWERLVAEHRGGQLALGLEAAAGMPFAPLAAEEADPRLRRELPAIAAFVERLLADARLLGAPGGGWRGVAGRWREVLRRWLAPGEDAEDLADELAELQRLDGVLPARWPIVQEAVAALLDSPSPGHGRLGEEPSVVDLLAARGVTFDHVALPRLVERVVPRRAREDPVLLDAERTAINRRLPAGVRVALKVEPAIAEERLLFRLALGSARTSLRLVWPRRDAAGRRLVPSTYLLAVARALTGRESAFAALGQGEDPPGAAWLGLREVALDPAPPADRPVLHAVERDLRAIRDALDPGLSLGWLRGAHPGLESGLRAERARGGFRDRGRLTAWDGLVAPVLGAAWLASRRGGPPGAGAGALALSASALESYSRCSFQFFIRQILRLESEPPSETRLELDALESGALYHELLAALYRDLAESGLLPLDAGRLAAAQERAARLFEGLRREPPWIAHEMPPALWALWRERAAADFAVLLEQDAAASTPGAAWRAVAFEQPFGGPEVPVELEIGGVRLAPRGAHDRIDAGVPGGGVRGVD
jgi:ATP-dependent helicase/nuclease subunit B